MRQSIALLSVCASAVLAQVVDNNQFKFFFPSGSEGDEPIAHVEVIDPATTVAHIACPTGTDVSQCGWGSGIEYTLISTTIYKATMKVDGLFTMSFSCTHDTAKSQAACGVTQTGAQTTGASSLTLMGSQIEFATASIADITTKSGQETKPTGASGMGSMHSATGMMPSATGTTHSATAAGASGSHTTSGSAAQKTGAGHKLGAEGSVLMALAGAAILNAL